LKRTTAVAPSSAGAASAWYSSTANPGRSVTTIASKSAIDSSPGAAHSRAPAGQAGHAQARRRRAGNGARACGGEASASMRACMRAQPSSTFAGDASAGCSNCH
jgi:hypothetical protein